MIFKTILANILLAGSVLAQMPAMPAPELKKLDYLVGTWTAEGTIPPGPWGAGGKFSVIHKNEWMHGNSTGFIGYDAHKNVYTSIDFTSRGRREVAQGSLNGDIWTWTSSETHDGQNIQQRTTNTILSPKSYIAKFEFSRDGTNWAVMMEAKVTKK